MENIRSRRTGKGAPQKSKPQLEPVTVRIPGEAKWKLELMARQDHRSVSAVFEWCIEVGSRLVDVDSHNGGTIANLAKATWDLGPVEQAVELSWMAPSLMDYQARAIVEMLRISPELFLPHIDDDVVGNMAKLRADGGFAREQLDTLEAMDLGHFLDWELIENTQEQFIALVLERHKSADRKPITRRDLISSAVAGDGP